MLKMLDLFSGIGGFSLAASWTGEIETVAFCEIDPFCQKVLKKNFPGVPIHDDIKTFTYATEQRLQKPGLAGIGELSTENRKGVYDRPQQRDCGSIDIICGGFPCQPASVAGNRKGTADDRWIWPEMLRVITEVKPTWCVLENVPGLLTLEQGLVFESCCLALESEGYEVQSFLIPACAVNAPHRRDRVWIIGFNITDTESVRLRGGGGQQYTERWQTILSGKQGWCEMGREIERCDSNVTDTSNQRLQGSERSGSHDKGQAAHGPIAERNHTWDEPWIEVASRLCGVDARVSDRVHRLKALGNSIVPQVAYQIFMAILEVGGDNHENQ